MANVVTKDSSKQEITKAIRKEARALAKTFGCTVSVTRRNYKSITVSVVSSERNHMCPDFRAWEVENPHLCASHYVAAPGEKRTYKWFTPWMNELLAGLDAIASQYNWDESDMMTDYFHCNFYQFIEVCSSLSSEKTAELDRAREAAQAIEQEADEVADNVVEVNFTNGSDFVEIEMDAETELEAQLHALIKQRRELEVRVEKTRRIKALQDAIAAEMEQILKLDAELERI